MKEILYYLAFDGKKFEEEYDCVQYERLKTIEAHKDEFQFFDYRREPIPIEEAKTAEIVYIVVKSDSCAEAIGNWFNSDECEDPFGGVYRECVGTWAYGGTIDKGDEWFKLELEIEKMQTLIAEINQ